MTERTPKVQYVVTLEGAADADTADAHTLRRLLKYAQRICRLRCIDARQLDPHDEGDVPFRFADLRHNKPGGST